MRWSSIPVAILTTVLMLFGAMSAPALAAPADATVQGYVLDSDSSNMLRGVSVEIFDVDPGEAPTATPIASTTSTNGSFSVAVAADDENESLIWARLSRPGYETTSHGPFSAWGGQETYLPDVYLTADPAMFGTLTGAVADPAGSALGNDRGRVWIYENGGSDADHLDYFVRSAWANQAGLWSAQLPPGQYRVRVFDDWDEFRPVWAGTGAESYGTAAVYTVTTGDTTGIPSLRLSEGAKIRGKVTDSKGAPISGVSVAAYDSAESEVESASTNSRGEYSLDGLVAGSYRILFSDDLGDYVGKWYPNASSLASAEAVTVTDRQVRAGVDGVLVDSTVALPDYTVSGKVLDRTGAGQRGARVTVYRKVGSQWWWVDETRVRKGGTFGFAELAAGQYTFQVRSQDSSPDDPGFETQWIGGAYRQDKAKVVTVGEAGRVSLGTLTVTRLGTLSGRITVPAVAGLPRLDRWVRIFNADGEEVAWEGTSATGDFVAAVAPGTYTAQFGAYRASEDWETEAPYLPQWWKGAYSPGTATKLTVTDGGAITGLNATLGRNLAAVTPPKISGSALTGRTLTVSPGAWNRQSAVSFAYQWKVGGVNAGTGTTYKVKSADRGKAITAAVTAQDKYGDFVSGAATAKAVVAKDVAKVTVSAKVAKPAKKKPKAARKATVTVALTLPGTATSRAAGQVRIYDGSKLIATVNVRKGKATKAVKLTKGTHRLKVVYAGSAQYTSATGTRTVKVK